MDLTPTPPPKLSIAYSASAELTIELAKALALVAPTSMTSEQQELWLRAAGDALDGIRAEEVRTISAELRRTVTRPNQIVPEIAKLVADKRSQRALPSTPERAARTADFEIGLEARERLYAARDQHEINQAQAWERNARRAAGLHVDPLPAPLTRDELDSLPSDMIALGLKGGFLRWSDGRLIENPAA